MVYPGTQFVYPALGGNYEASLRVRDDGTFNGDDDNDGGGRKVRISLERQWARGLGGRAAHAARRVRVPN